MPPAARVTDLTTHGAPLSPGPGSSDVLIGYLPAWRTLIDLHACPLVSVSGADGVGTVIMGSPTVLIDYQMACRVLDIVVEVPGLVMGPMNPIAMGEMTVIIGEAGSPGGTAPASSDQTTLENIKGLLKKCATGKEAVKYLDDQKIPVTFADGNGSYWDGKKIVISRGKSINSTALTMVHELHHARSAKNGTSGKVSSDKRDVYVKKMVEEETVGTVKSIQAKNELVASGEKISDTFPLESQYNQSYAKAAQDYKKASPDAAAADIDAAGQKAGLDSVRSGFNDGTVVTSNTHEKYPDYYGKSWDKGNPK